MEEARLEDSNPMEKKESLKEKPDPARVELVKNLPKEVLQSLTKEEVKILISDEEWPDSLHEKLKEFVVKENA